MTTTPKSPAWRVSSYSGSSGTCVEVADEGEHVLVRNSQRPDAGTLSFTSSQMAAWVAGCKAGDFDDLT